MTPLLRAIEGESALAYELQIQAPPEIVWRFWTEPDAFVKWMGKVATLDPKPDGIFRIDYGQGDVIDGRYLEVEAPRRLVVSWSWRTDAGLQEAGRVEVELAPVDDGSATLLRLRHHGLAQDGQASHDEGWRHFLPALVAATAESWA